MKSCQQRTREYLAQGITGHGKPVLTPELIAAVQAARLALRRKKKK